MAKIKHSNRLAWLAATLSEQRSRISDLLRGMAGLGNRGGMKPSVFHKLIRMLDQVAEAKAEETRTLNYIEAIEKLHKSRRKNRQLRRAEPRPKAKPVVQDEPGCVRPAGLDLLGLLAFWYLMTRRGINDKKQSLTID